MMGMSTDVDLEPAESWGLRCELGRTCENGSNREGEALLSSVLLF